MVLFFVEGSVLEGLPPDLPWDSLLETMPFNPTEQLVLAIRIDREKKRSRRLQAEDVQDTMSQPSTPTSPSATSAISETTTPRQKALKEQAYFNACHSANEEPHITLLRDGDVSLSCEICPQSTPRKTPLKYFSEHCHTTRHQNQLRLLKRQAYAKIRGFIAAHVDVACHTLFPPNTLQNWDFTDNPKEDKRICKPCAKTVSGATARALVANCSQHNGACGSGTGANSNKKPKSTPRAQVPNPKRQMTILFGPSASKKAKREEQSDNDSDSVQDATEDDDAADQREGRSADADYVDLATLQPQISTATSKKSKRPAATQRQLPTRASKRQRPNPTARQPIYLDASSGADSPAGSRNSSPRTVGSIGRAHTGRVAKRPTAKALREELVYPMIAKRELCFGVGLNQKKDDVIIWMAIAAGPKRYQWLRQMGTTEQWELLDWCAKYPQDWVYFKRWVPTVTNKHGKKEHVVVKSTDVKDWHMLEQLRRVYKADSSHNHGHVQPNLEDDEYQDEEPSTAWVERQRQAAAAEADAAPSM